jgi:hypothetical protein
MSTAVDRVNRSSVVSVERLPAGVGPGVRPTSFCVSFELPRPWLPGVNSLCLFLQELRRSGGMAADWHFGCFENPADQRWKRVTFDTAEDAFHAMASWEGGSRALRAG